MWLMQFTFHALLDISVWVSHILHAQKSIWLKALVLDRTVLDHSVLNSLCLEGNQDRFLLIEIMKKIFKVKKHQILSYWWTDKILVSVRRCCPLSHILSKFPIDHFPQGERIRKRAYPFVDAVAILTGVVGSKSISINSFHKKLG